MAVIWFDATKLLSGSVRCWFYSYNGLVRCASRERGYVDLTYLAEEPWVTYTKQAGTHAYHALYSPSSRHQYIRVSMTASRVNRFPIATKPCNLRRQYRDPNMSSFMLGRLQ